MTIKYVINDEKLGKSFNCRVRLERDDEAGSVSIIVETHDEEWVIASLEPEGFLDLCGGIESDDLGLLLDSHGMIVVRR